MKTGRLGKLAFAIVLSLCMVVTLIPGVSFAGQTVDDTEYYLCSYVWGTAGEYVDIDPADELNGGTYQINDSVRLVVCTNDNGTFVPTDAFRFYLNDEDKGIGLELGSNQSGSVLVKKDEEVVWDFTLEGARQFWVEDQNDNQYENGDTIRIGDQQEIEFYLRGINTEDDPDEGGDIIRVIGWDIDDESVAEITGTYFQNRECDIKGLNNGTTELNVKFKVNGKRYELNFDIEVKGETAFIYSGEDPENVIGDEYEMSVGETDTITLAPANDEIEFGYIQWSVDEGESEEQIVDLGDDLESESIEMTGVTPGRATVTVEYEVLGKDDTESISFDVQVYGFEEEYEADAWSQEECVPGQEVLLEGVLCKYMCNRYGEYVGEPERIPKDDPEAAAEKYFFEWDVQYFEPDSDEPADNTGDKYFSMTNDPEEFEDEGCVCGEKCKITTTSEVEDGGHFEYTVSANEILDDPDEWTQVAESRTGEIQVRDEIISIYAGYPIEHGFYSLNEMLNDGFAVGATTDEFYGICMKTYSDNGEVKEDYPTEIDGKDIELQWDYDDACVKLSEVEIDQEEEEYAIGKYTLKRYSAANDEISVKAVCDGDVIAENSWEMELIEGGMYFFDLNGRNEDGNEYAAAFSNEGDFEMKVDVSEFENEYNVCYGDDYEFDGIFMADFGIVLDDNDRNIFDSVIRSYDNENQVVTLTIPGEGAGENIIRQLQDLTGGGAILAVEAKQDIEDETYFWATTAVFISFDESFMEIDGDGYRDENILIGDEKWIDSFPALRIKNSNYPNEHRADLYVDSDDITVSGDTDAIKFYDDNRIKAVKPGTVDITFGLSYDLNEKLNLYFDN